MSKVAKATISLMIATMLSKILGFGRELILGAYYGTTKYSDIYIASINIPSSLFVIIGVALVTIFIPLYHENKNEGGESQAINFTNNIFNIVLVIAIVISLIGLIFTEPIVKLFVMGFENDRLNMTIKFTRIMMIGGIFVVLCNVITPFLNVKGNFIIPGLIGLPYSIIIIASIVLSTKISIYILPIGTMIAMLSQFIFLYPFAVKNGYRYKPILNLNDKYIKKTMFLVIPVIIGVCVNQINTIIDRTIASTLVEGSISALNYANKLNLFASGIFISTLGTAIYPMLSELSVNYDLNEFKYSVKKSINTVILLMTPISIGAIVLSYPIVKLLFQRGAFNEKATVMTTTAVIFYSIGIVSNGVRDITSKIFFALRDTKTPMINGAIGVCINIILNIVLSKYMGYAGLAFATSISSILTVIIIFFSLRKKLGDFGQGNIYMTIIKSIIASIIMGIVTLFTYGVLYDLLGIGIISELISLFISIGVGAIMYGILVIILGVEDVKIIVDIIKNKIR